MEQTMADRDTICLLKECDSGIKMGIISINEALNDVQTGEITNILKDARKDHETLQAECVSLLNANHDSGKSPSLIAQNMSRMKTAMRMVTTSDTSRAAASIMTDGCNMGIKSLHGYLNEYKSASAPARELAQKVIRTEENLLNKLKPYL